MRKIGTPCHAEYGIEAVVDGENPQLMLNEEALRAICNGAEFNAAVSLVRFFDVSRPARLLSSHPEAT